MNTNKHTASAPGRLYDEVRASFVIKRTSLAKWCEDNGEIRQNVYKAFLGSDQVRAQSWACALRERVLMAAGLGNERRAA
jgi:hypothetical protein